MNCLKIPLCLKFMQRIKIRASHRGTPFRWWHSRSFSKRTLLITILTTFARAESWMYSYPMLWYTTAFCIAWYTIFYNTLDLSAKQRNSNYSISVRATLALVPALAQRISAGDSSSYFLWAMAARLPLRYPARVWPDGHNYFNCVWNKRVNQSLLQTNGTGQMMFTVSSYRLHLNYASRRCL
jgi:hypothetical protein